MKSIEMRRNANRGTCLIIFGIIVATLTFQKELCLARGNEVEIEGHKYSIADLGPFTPSGAVYFMDGSSDATVKIYATGDSVTLRFADQSTSISASAPFIYNEKQVNQGVFAPVPPPLTPIAHFPKQVPNQYRRATTLHLMQVISMNMQAADGESRLLIGLPYAEKYPKLFGRTDIFDGGMNAASYGVVQSLTEYKGPGTHSQEINSNGYPARSIFAVYHVIETKMGAFFNKKATIMELQPDKAGKLALTLPPIPFDYELKNGPIPLFDVNNPDGPTVGEVVIAHHKSSRATTSFSSESWPLHTAKP